MAESRGETEESDNAVDEKTNTNRLAEAIKLWLFCRICG